MVEASLDELLAFVAVVDLSSFAGAAKQLGRDTSAVSRRITQLEHRLGARLLTRTTRSVTPTEVGARYYQRVQSILEALEAANGEASDMAAAPRGQLRVAFPLAFGRRWIAPLLTPFAQAYPDIVVDARFGDRFVDLVAEGYDAAIRIGKLGDSTLVARKIADYRTFLVASPDYISAHGSPASPQDLNQHMCLGFTGHISWPHWHLSNGAKRETVHPKGPIIADNSEVLLTAASTGAGIILAPNWLTSGALQRGELVEVLPGWRGANDGAVYMVFPPGRIIPAKTRVFADEIEARLAAAW